ncbi:cell division protein FtsL [candidate division KSB1 bacterium]|nr:cell division protein FtsL [candidate division KSB1 bacterium]
MITFRNKNSKKYKLNALLGIVIVMILAVGMLFQVWLKVKIRLIASEIENLKKNVVTLREDTNRLQTRAINLSSYERITRLAQNELGMIFVKQEVLTETRSK